MKRWQLVAKVSAEASLPRAKAETVVKGVFDAISQELASGEAVTIPGFGSFTARERASRVGRNPQTGEAMVIDARRVPVFKPSRALREAVAS